MFPRKETYNAFSVVCVSSGSAETLFMCDGKVNKLLIVQPLSNTFANNYENQIMLSQVTAKNIGMLFCDSV